jgi:hypothetical protein
MRRMLPCTPQIFYLRRCEGAYVQTSLSWAFLLDGQTGLSLVARSTFPRNKIELLAISSWLLAKPTGFGEELKAKS